MNAMSTSNFSEIKPHDHLCLLYRRPNDWKSAVTNFLQTGLEENHKCLYISGAYSGSTVKEYLKEAGVDLVAKVEQGQLLLLDKEESYAQEQEFVPAKMINFLKDAAEEAVAEGYDALRVTGEISWALDYENGREKIINYELKLNQELFPHHSVIALCRYNLNKFSPEMIKNVIKTHPYIILENQIQHNPYYIKPNQYRSEPKEVEQWLENIMNFTDLRGRFRTVVQRSQEQLERTNKELEQLLYITSHDLRSPLINIQGFSQELESDIQNIQELLVQKDDYSAELAYYFEEALPESLAYIKESTRRIDDLLGDLAKLARITVDNLNKDKVNIEELVEEVRDNFAYQIQSEEAEVNISPLPDCYGDRKQLKRVFSNLLDNAIKYLSPDQKGLIWIQGWSLEERVVYAVSDNGIGIAKEEQREIFTIFSRGSEKDSISGQGIGLALVKKIIDLHQGKVWLEAQEGQGSTFFFSIPDFSLLQKI